MDKPLLYYEVHGDNGPYLLLVHGLLSSRAQWLPNVAGLKKFCRPVIVELFGHGRSPSPENPDCYKPDNYVLEFERIRQDLGAKKWFVCGQSLGASLTLLYALHYPEHIAAQVFTNSQSSLSDITSDETLEIFIREIEKEGRKAIDNSSLQPGKNRHLPSVIKKALVEDINLINLRGFTNTIVNTVRKTAVNKHISKIKIPTLLIAGRFDKQFAPLIEVAKKSIVNLEVLILDGGHAVNIDAADQFNQAVKELITRSRE